MFGAYRQRGNPYEDPPPPKKVEAATFVIQRNDEHQTPTSGSYAPLTRFQLSGWSSDCNMQATRALVSDLRRRLPDQADKILDFAMWLFRYLSSRR